MDDAIELLTEIRAGSALFRSSGFAYVKVTVDGQARLLKLPIRSTGVAEILERRRKNAPQPPVVDVLVKPDSEMGRELKLRSNQWCRVPDFADQTYRDALDEHQTDLMLEALDAGLALPFADAEGQPVTDLKGKLDILKGLGLSMPQFTQIVNAIQDLTTLTDDDKQRFFGRRSGSGANGIA